MAESRDPRRGSGGTTPPATDHAGEWEYLGVLMDQLVQRVSGTEGAVGAGAEDLAREARSQLGRMRESVAMRERRVAELRSRQDEFLSVVAHDLRTPLVAIQGFAQLILAGGGVSERQRTYVERILQGVRAMSRLVEDLRTARRLDQGALALEAIDVDPEGFTDDLVEMHREEARQKEVEIRIDAEEALPRLRCDPERLGQALGNLVQNAVKFSPRGSGVVVRLRATPSHLRFEVADEGPGVAEELMPRLFQRFTQGPSAADAAGKGFGLGLHICREIVLLHGGRVGAENQPRGGSLFWAELPLGEKSGEAAVGGEGP